MDDEKVIDMTDTMISDDMWIYGFTMIDNGIIYCKDITDSEFRTYSVIRSLVNQRKKIAWPSYETVAEMSGHSKRTAIRNVEKLEQLDLIQKISRSGTSNQFIVKKLQNSSVLKSEQDIQDWVEEHPVEQPKKQDKPKEPEKADPIPYKDIMDYLNNQAGTKFNHTGQAHQKLIKARWNELMKAKFPTEEIVIQFIHVIDVKVAQWKDSDMSQYLRPSTLFGNKFDQYRNEAPGQKSFGQTGQASDNRFDAFLNSDD